MAMGPDKLAEILTSVRKQFSRVRRKNGRWQMKKPTHFPVERASLFSSILRSTSIDEAIYLVHPHGRRPRKGHQYDQINWPKFCTGRMDGRSNPTENGIVIRFIMGKLSHLTGKWQMRNLLRLMNCSFWEGNRSGKSDLGE